MVEEVGGQAEELGALEEDVSGLEEDVSELVEDVSGLEEDVSGLEEDRSGQEEVESGLVEDGSELEEDVSGLVEEVRRPQRSKQARRFMKRGKYRRIQKKKQRTTVQLTTNYSDLELSPAQERVLNKGLNFCPQPESVNRTKVGAGLERMARSICWADYFNGRDLEQVDRETPLVPVKKTNFPPTEGVNKYVPSSGVKEFLSSTHDALVSAPLKPFSPNLPEDELVALKELRKEQQKRNIVIKPNDKMGGQSIMNTSDYVRKVDTMLNDTYTDENGEEKRYYQGPLAGMYVDKHYIDIKRFLEESADNGIINKSDVKNLLPEEPTPGRLYGMVKNHKDIPEGETIPPLRPVVYIKESCRNLKY